VLGVVRDLRSPRSLADPTEAADYQEHLLAEFVLARLAHGVADSTIRRELAAVEEFLASAGVWAWEVEPRHADRFLGHDQHGRAHDTRRGKAGAIDFFYRFLELRYRGELHELTGRLVCSPIDECNRPRHSGDFTVLVPPSPAALASFFAGWRAELATSRKWLTGARHYAMARLAAEVGLRLRELCALGLEVVFPRFSGGELLDSGATRSLRRVAWDDVATRQSSGARWWIWSRPAGRSPTSPGIWGSATSRSTPGGGKPASTGAWCPA
jgi:hypothetical protein